MSRYHKAAIDGYLDLLKEATKKDLNTPDEDGMTPTILAAFHGHVDALQLICSRQGDPNRSDIWGNTPLHHAAANGHMHILSFLINFGANLFTLDNEFHTAMDVAASRDRMDCVRFLDAAASKQTNQNPKKVAHLKKEAQKEAEKRVKRCEVVKKRHQNKMDKMYGGPGSGSVSETSTSTNDNLSGVSEQFSKLTAADATGSLRATLQKRFGKKDKGTLQRPGGEGNVIFLKQDNKTPENPDFLGVFNEQDENMFEGDRMAGYDDDEEPGQVQQSIFNRPGLGGLIFMKKMGVETDDIPSASNESLGYLFQTKMFEAEGDDADFEGNDASDLTWDQEELGLDDEDDEETSSLEVFLAAIYLPEFSLAFSREHLDLEALMLCSDEDLKGIRIQLGPRKKILEAVARRKNALDSPGIMKDSFL
ncbi:ankyrin repeat and SAM domain-containing protein 4B [Thalassophryne amazonica]|uniref:ankyrin repeat and SAM domain-containing protein 4B n=1 Tax=Thalassophryne amazonica TaxID=390379 RepID=UPI0014714618|nr:ankyrin repeat and SAM domain-containing protein 4B [Thalassophryne amazonica]XP_034045343.1 ankyrin repeat and SAM domain-containing protein 4B [Thalassophryne amazonica]